jgi:phage-related protein
VPLKPLVCLGSSRDDLRAFPDEARQRAGYELHRLQEGLTPTDWKPMTTVGSGVEELRVKVGRAFRVLYIARFREAIYVLHAFEKKTEQTAKREIDVARKRLTELKQQRARGER